MGESFVLEKETGYRGLLREHCPVSQLSTNETFRQEMVFMTRFQSSSPGSSSSYFLKHLEEKQELNYGSFFTKVQVLEHSAKVSEIIIKTTTDDNRYNG